MFIETHSDSDITLAFIKSANVQAYPCGRRRSTIVDKDGNSGTTNDQYHFPFDPEARLNTEANNRKHSSLNGYAQTYLHNWGETNHILTLSLAGYLFNITLDENNLLPAAFGANILSNLLAKDTSVTSATNIYANILLEEVHLFSGFQEYYTEVLRNQSASVSGFPETSLDLLTTPISETGSITDRKDFNNFYFSGLSFSTTPLTGDTSSVFSKKDIIVTRDAATNKTAKQTAVSLCFLVKNGGNTWCINEAAKLPAIVHGDTPNSVVMGDLYADNINILADINAVNLHTDTIDNRLNITAGEKITSKNLEVQNNIIAKTIGTTSNKVDNIYTKYADVGMLTAANLSVSESISAPLLGQTINGVESHVPFIDLKPQTDGTGKTVYQLQISRVGPIKVD